MNYFEEMLAFIESAEMRDHLRTCADRFALRKCVDIIAAAYTPLAEKEAAICRICEDSKDEEIRKTLTFLRAGIAARYEDCDNAVFTLTRRESDFFWEDGARLLGAEESFDRARWDNETTLHADYAAAVAALKDFADFDDHGDPRGDNPRGAKRVWWFTIEKWGNVDGEMELLIDWTLDMNGDEIYFKSPSYWHNEVRTSHLTYDTFPEQMYVFLPIPFQLGDIITIGRRPFVDVFHAVVVDLDSCGSVAFVNEQGELKKDLLGLMHAFPYAVSPFYRVSRFTGELPEREVAAIRAFGETEEDGKGDDMNYFEEMLEFIESAEMREYLKTRADWFEPHSYRVFRCAETIAASYFLLTQKEAALSRIYDAVKDFNSDDFLDGYAVARNFRRKERGENGATKRD
ncbi:hypothetical protein FACS189490_09470 [Clostridia bacterium]|nr:hypothetical protein FACS189490_09470 [Clostridia bacterium]